MSSGASDPRVVRKDRNKLMPPFVLRLSSLLNATLEVGPGKRVPDTPVTQRCQVNAPNYDRKHATISMTNSLHLPSYMCLCNFNLLALPTKDWIRLYATPFQSNSSTQADLKSSLDQPGHSVQSPFQCPASPCKSEQAFDANPCETLTP